MLQIFATIGSAIKATWEAATIFQKINMVFQAATLAIGVKGFFQARDLLARGQDILANKTAAGGKIPVIYGRRRVGAQIVYMDTASNRSKDLFIVYALSVGECEEIEGRTIELDGNPITDPNRFRDGSYIGSDKINSGAGSLNTADQVGTNNGNAVAGGFGTNPAHRYRAVFNLHHGAATQTADPMLRASVGSQWTTAHKLNGITYIAASYEYDTKAMFKSVPQLTVVVKGQKVYDPRFDSTVTGGSGSQRLATPSTYAWNDNAACCFLNYLTNDSYGKGLTASDLDLESFRVAAALTDTLVDTPDFNGSFSSTTWSASGGTTPTNVITFANESQWSKYKLGDTLSLKDSNGNLVVNEKTISDIQRNVFYGQSQQNIIIIDDEIDDDYDDEGGTSLVKSKRFHCNGVIDTNKNVMENAKELLGNMRGILNYVDGKYELLIEDTGSSEFTVTDDHIIDGISIDYGNKDNRANKVVVEFFNGAQGYEQDTATVYHNNSSSTYKDDDGGEELEVKVAAPLAVSPYVAWNMGKAVLARSRYQTSINFLATPELYKVNVGSIISVDYAGLGLTNPAKPFRIETMDLQANGLIAISAIEYIDIYTWQVPPVESVPPASDIPTGFELVVPTGLLLTDTSANNPRAYLSWTANLNYPVDSYRVIVLDSNSNSVINAIVNSNYIYLDLLPVGSYNATVTAINSVGTESNPSSSYAFSIAKEPIATDDVQDNAITNVKVNDLSAVKINTGELNLGTASGMAVKQAKSGYTDNTTGFWLGNDGGTPKFNIGTSTNHFKFDGTGVSIKGALEATALTIDGNATISGTLDASHITVDGDALDTLLGVAGTGANKVLSLGYDAKNKLEVTGTHLKYTAYDQVQANGDLALDMFETSATFYPSASRIGWSPTVINSGGQVTTTNLELNTQTTPTYSTSNLLYNVGGALYWNGNAVGTGNSFITSIVAGTNLNGGGNTGTVTINLDSTITGNHTFSNNVIIGGDLTVQGTTVTVDTTNLDVKDKNITINYSTGDSSASANGAGITIQDAVSAGNDATLTWNTANDSFNFTHAVNVTGNIGVTGTVDGRDIATDGTKLDGIEAGATTDQTQAEINALGITATGLSGTPNISVGTINSEAITITTAAVPLRFVESGNTGAGQYWRMPLDSGDLRFDVSTGGGASFSSYDEVFRMKSNGSINIQGTQMFDTTGSINTTRTINSSTIVSTGSITVFQNVLTSTNSLKLDSGQSSISLFNTGTYDAIYDAGTHFFRNASGAERLRIDSIGRIGLSGANYGSSGQVLTSNGNSHAPSWQDSSGVVTTYTNGANNRIITSTGTAGINGEGNLTFDGSTLGVTGTISSGAIDIVKADSGATGIGNVRSKGTLWQQGISGSGVGLAMSVNSGGYPLIQGMYNDNATTRDLYLQPYGGGIYTGAITSTGNLLSQGYLRTEQYLQVFEGNSQVGFIGKEKTILGSGSSLDMVIFAESISNGGDLHFMTGGSGTKRMSIDASGNIQVNGTTVIDASRNITAGTISSTGQLTLNDYALINAGTTSNTTLEPVIWARSKIGASIIQLNVKAQEWQFGGGGTLDTSPTLTINTNTNLVNFAGGIQALSGMAVFSTSLGSDDWQNSPISIRERGAAASSSNTSDAYAPNLNFHFAPLTSNSLWMNSTGQLSYGSYDSSGVPSANGIFRAGQFNIGTTTVIDASRNLTNIGTINSGAITTSGQLLAEGTASNTVPKYSFQGDTNTGLGYIGADQVGLIVAGSRVFYVSAGSSKAFFQNLSNGVDIANGLNVSSGVYAVAGTTVIDASRQLQNINGLGATTTNTATGSGVGFKFVATDTVVDQAFNGFLIDHNVSGSDTATADRTHIALSVDQDSSATGGDTSNEHRVYGANISSKATGDSDLIRGINISAIADQDSGTVTNVQGLNAVGRAQGEAQTSNVYGVYAYAQKYNGGNTTNMYGSFGHALIQSSNTGAVTTATGSYGEVQIDSNTTLNTATGVRSIIDRNNGTINTGYLYRGNYQGTLPTTAWGVYIDTDVPNYFGGSIQSSSLKIGNSTVIDASRNLSSIGTISSGAITSTGKLTLNDPSVGGWIQSNTSVRIDIDTDNNQTDRAFIVSKNNSASSLLTIFESGAATFAGTINSGAITSSAVQTFTKSVYGSENSENYYRIKLQEQGGVHNDVGIGQTTSGNMGFNVTAGQSFIFNNGTSGHVAHINSTGVDAKVGGFIINGTTVIDASRNLTNIGTISSGAITASNGTIQSRNTSGTNRGVILNFNGEISQTSSDSSWLHLNRSHNGNVVVGYNSTADFDVKNNIKVNSTTVIDASRNLTNINIASSAQVEVTNTSTSTGEILFLKGGGSSGAGVLYNRNDSFTWYAGIGGGSGTGSIPLSYFGIVNRSQATLPFVIAHTTGNVGIGVSDPEKKLEVKSDTTNDGILIDVLSKPEIIFRDRGNSDTIIGTGRYQLDGFHIDTYSGNALFIRGSDREVGIGKTNPTQKLDVNGNIGINGTQVIDASRNLTNIATANVAGNITIDYTGNSTNDAGLRVFNDNNDWGIYIDKDGSATYGLKIAADGEFPFQIVNSSQVEKFRVDSDGDIETVRNINASGTISAAPIHILGATGGDKLAYASNFEANGANIQLTLERTGSGWGGIGASGGNAFMVYSSDIGLRFGVTQAGSLLANGGTEFLTATRDLVNIASATVVGSITSENAIKTTNGRLQLGYHTSGSGIWFDRSSAVRQWFTGIESADSTIFRLYWAGSGSGNKFLLDANGNGVFAGDVQAYSDERLKDNIQTLDGKKALQMRGVSFTRDGRPSSGVIAQEVEKIAPELVMTAEDEMGTKSVAYGNLVGYLIETVKDQQAQIDELKAMIEKVT